MSIDDRISIKKQDLKRLEHGISVTMIYVFVAGRKDPICCSVKDTASGKALINELISTAES
jgi:hypothetical protein